MIAEKHDSCTANVQYEQLVSRKSEIYHESHCKQKI